ETADAVIGAVRAALVREHDVAPGTVALVRPGAIPRTTSGKIQRSATRAAFTDGTLPVVRRSDTGAPQPQAAPAAPAAALDAGRVRAVVAELAARRLGVTVDPAAPLVGQGLDSLAAVELQAAVAGATGVELSLEELLAGASVDDLTLEAPAAPAAALDAGRVRAVVAELAARRLGVTVDPAAPLVGQGLDSLAAVELQAAVAGATGVELSLEELLAGASVDDLTLDAPAAPAARPASAAPGERLPLSTNQQAMVFLEQQHPGTSALHISLAVRLLTEVRHDALHRAFQQLVDRHPVLRTALRWADGEPYQSV